MLALVTLIAALAGGAAIGPALAALSLPAWASILSVLLPAGEDAVKLFVQLHPELQKLEGELLAQARSGIVNAHRVQGMAERAAGLAFVQDDDFDRRNTFG